MADTRPAAAVRGRGLFGRAFRAAPGCGDRAAIRAAASSETATRPSNERRIEISLTGRRRVVVDAGVDVEALQGDGWPFGGRDSPAALFYAPRYRRREHSSRHLGGPFDFRDLHFRGHQCALGEHKLWPIRFELLNNPANAPGEPYLHPSIPPRQALD